MWSSIPWTSKGRANKRFGRFVIGVGVWDSWGFGFDYCHYSKAVTIEFIHWYVYAEYWTKEESKERKEDLDE